jgi:5-methylcytosine-specific restriction endonuclease McrA
MNDFLFGHLSNDVAWSSYVAAESRETADTAMTLALLAEVDERKLYLPAGYPSMRDYCIRARHMSRARAEKRIRVARAGREFPAIFPAIAEGRLGLSAAMLLAPRLTRENSDELLVAATHKTNEGIEQLLAERFPRSEPLLAAPAIEPTDAAGEVAARRPVPGDTRDTPISMEPVPAAPAPKHSGWHYSYSSTREEKLAYVQSLLAHARPGASVDQLLDAAVDCLQAKLEHQKFGKCARPGRRRGSKNPRYIPLEVKRAVWERDGGQCAFVGTGGRRCDARAPLEFDHRDPVARGGRATVAGVRLLCRAHNQYTAERTYGEDFMRGKREQAKQRAAEARAKREAKEAAKAAADAAAKKADEIIPWLRELGYNLQRARRGVELTAHIPDAPIEERMKVALRGLAPKCVRILPHATSSPV